MNRRMQLALDRARECERMAAAAMESRFRDQWLDLARQWRLAESARRSDHDND
jgi:hypothetical protein